MSEWGEDAVDTTCGSCGNTRPCVLLPDPFLAELFPEDLTDADTKWWCRDCYEHRIFET